jgi:hypothetical protein
MPWDDHAMEHRWGQRIGVDIPVRVTGHPFTVRVGRLANLSVSGAFVRAECDLRLLSRVNVAIELPQRARHDAPLIAAYVARKSRDGFGIEWCQFAPPDVSRLLQSFTVRRHARLRKPEPPAAVVSARRSPPLLKHST